MKKLILAGLIAAMPLFAQADVNINVGGSSVQTLRFGNQDSRGYYWDGGAWRDRNYWERHHGPRGEAQYTGRSNHDRRDHRDDKGRFKGHQDQRKCPPGQAKKGRC